MYGSEGMVWQNIRQLKTLNLLILEISEAEFNEAMKIRKFTPARGWRPEKASQSLVA
jgi:hypothetical protein